MVLKLRHLSYYPDFSIINTFDFARREQHVTSDDETIIVRIFIEGSETPRRQTENSEHMYVQDYAVLYKF